MINWRCFLFRVHFNIFEKPKTKSRWYLLLLSLQNHTLICAVCSTSIAVAQWLQRFSHILTCAPHTKTSGSEWQMGREKYETWVIADTANQTRDYIPIKWLEWKITIQQIIHTYAEQIHITLGEMWGEGNSSGGCYSTGYSRHAHRPFWVRNTHQSHVLARVCVCETSF